MHLNWIKSRCNRHGGPGCVLGSRLADLLLRENAATDTLTASPEVRGTRIANGRKKDPEQAIGETIKRDRFDHDPS